MMRATLRRARTPLRVLAGLLLAGAVLAAAAAGGVAVTMGESFPSGPAIRSPAAGWPAPQPVASGRTVVAVALGATGSVVGDVLPPYEAFARSDRFTVYTVAARREPVALSGGLRVLPDRTFGEVNGDGALRPDVIVVPAVAEPRGAREAALRAWIARHAARGTRILGVCAGSDLLAATGVLDGRHATSFWDRIGSLEQTDPAVRWVRGQRYVQDGPVTTTAGVTSGIAGALRLVEQLAGPEEARRVGRELSYPGWSPDGSTAIPVNTRAPADLPYVLNAAFPWWRPTVGVVLTGGAGETDLAAAFEVYSGTSFAARLLPVAAERTTRTRHGMLLLAEPVAASSGSGELPALDRLLVPGVRAGGEMDARLAGWAHRTGLRPELPHRGSGAGRSAFDPVLRDLAAWSDQATARATAKFTEYPAAHLRLDGPVWPWRPTALLLATLVVAAAAALLPWRPARRLIARGKQTGASHATKG